MSLSAVGKKVLLEREGRVLKAYKDTQGVWTIGAGITSASGLIKVIPGLILTSAECDALNEKAFELYAGYLDKALTPVIPAQHTYDALHSFLFNIGPGAFRKSTCLKRIKAGDLKGAKAAMLLWNKPAIIISRRQAEADQLVTPYDVRMPSRVLGAAPVKSTAAPPVTGPVVPVIPLPAPPVRQPDITLPGWLRALIAFVEAVMASQPAKRAF